MPDQVKIDFQPTANKIDFRPDTDVGTSNEEQQNIKRPSFDDPLKQLLSPTLTGLVGPVASSGGQQILQFFRNLAQQGLPVAAAAGTAAIGQPELAAPAFLATKGLVSPETVQQHPVATGIETTLAGLPAMAKGVQGSKAGIGFFRGIFKSEAALKAAGELQNVRKLHALIEVPASEVSLAGPGNIPERGLLSAGLDLKKLSPLNPIERAAAIRAARESAGQALDSTLAQAEGRGTINVFQALKDATKNVPERLLNTAIKRFNEILQAKGINTNNLSRLSPLDARIVQRSLDEFADFAPTPEVFQNFKQVATQARRNISAATRKIVPESRILDEHYGDLALATDSAEEAAKKFFVGKGLTTPGLRDVFKILLRVGGKL